MQQQSCSAPPIGRQRATRFARAGNACRHPRTRCHLGFLPSTCCKMGECCWARRRNETEQSRLENMTFSLPAIGRPPSTREVELWRVTRFPSCDLRLPSASRRRLAGLSNPTRARGHGRDNGSPTNMCDDRTTTTPSSSVVCLRMSILHPPENSSRLPTLTDAAHVKLKAASADALLAGATLIYQADVAG